MSSEHAIDPSNNQVREGEGGVDTGDVGRSTCADGQTSTVGGHRAVEDVGDMRGNRQGC